MLSESPLAQGANESETIQARHRALRIKSWQSHHGHYGCIQTLILGLALIEVDASFFCHSFNTSGLESFNSFGGKIESDPTVTLRPPYAL